MSGELGSVVIRGEPISAWLAACAVVRFAGLDAARVHVQPHGAVSPDEVFVRPEMSRLHRSLGLNAAQLPGAKPAAAWRFGGKQVPLSPFGAPLGGAAFVNVWSRARASEDLSDLWAFNAMQPVAGCYRVPSGVYAQAVEGIARRAGVQACEPSSISDVGLVIEAGASERPVGEQAPCRKIGLTALACPELDELKLLSLDLCLRVLIATWPRRGGGGREEGEYDRRIASITAVVQDMRGLVVGGAPNRHALAHRRRVWTELGRIVPVDDDPFISAEWIAALLHAGDEPVGYPLIVDAIPMDDVRRHVHAQLAQEASVG